MVNRGEEWLLKIKNSRLWKKTKNIGESLVMVFVPVAFNGSIPATWVPTDQPLLLVVGDVPLYSWLLVILYHPD